MSDENAESVEESADTEGTDEGPSTEADAEPEETQAGLEEGDFIQVAYTARTAEDGRLVDTTDESVAEEEGIEEEGREYGPRTIVLGAGHIFPTIESAIEGKDVGFGDTVTVSAAEAFGEYDQDQVRTVSVDKIPEDDRYPGAPVEIDGERGHVETIIGGRARVDFNHPLAGQDIEYDFEIVGQVEDRLEQAQGLLDMFINADLDMEIRTDEVEEEVPVEPDEDDDEEGADEPETEIEMVEKETLYIESIPQLSMNQQWLFQKQQIAQDLMNRLDLDRVIVQETFEQTGMMGGFGGGMPGPGGPGEADLEDALEDVDVDTEEILEDLDTEDIEE